MSQNYTALITGAASGIGYETSRQFIESGAIVIGVDINEEHLQSARNSLGDGFVPMVSNIGNSGSIGELFRNVENQIDKIDALINNAGKMTVARLEELESDMFDLDIGILLKGPMMLVKYFAPLLRKSSNPSIINIASTAALLEIPKQSLYAVAKAALIKFTQSCVAELPGIRTNCVLPGLIETSILNIFGDKNLAKMKENHSLACPCGRIGKPDDVANVILFLCSDKATYINGTSIEVDGGSTRASNVKLF